MSFEQEVPYEPISEVEKKVQVAKKAMSEAIAAKWLSMNYSQESPKTSYVRKISKLIEDQTFRKYQRNKGNKQSSGSQNHA